MEIERLVRENIRKLQPYSCARDEYKGGQAIFLDANENPYETGYNRYPDPNQWTLKERIAELKGVSVEHIVLGNGSDEIIDLLIRSFCEPGEEDILVFSPSYSMYEVSAAINKVNVQKVGLTPEFLPDWPSMWQQIGSQTKIIFLCTPNNPTGQVIPQIEIERLCQKFEGLIVVDEAYIDFTNEPSVVSLLENYPQLVVIQTLSKAWGMAGLRLGICLADRRVVEVLNKVKAPYNIGSLTQKTALEVLKETEKFRERRDRILSERTLLIKGLRDLGIFRQVYDSEANFILVLSDTCRKLYYYLVEHQVVVRLRDMPPLIKGGLRITVGRREENDRLLKLLRRYKQEK